MTESLPEYPLRSYRVPLGVHVPPLENQCSIVPPSCLRMLTGQSLIVQSQSTEGWLKLSWFGRWFIDRTVHGTNPSESSHVGVYVCECECKSTCKTLSSHTDKGVPCIALLQFLTIVDQINTELNLNRWKHLLWGRISQYVDSTVRAWHMEQSQLKPLLKVGQYMTSSCRRSFNFIIQCLFQGDRFGGALDAAAKQFSGAFDSGMLPMEFVNKMKKDGKLIMGIGHRVKSVSSLVFFSQIFRCVFGLSIVLVEIATVVKGGFRVVDIGKDEAARVWTAVSPAPWDWNNMCKVALLRYVMSLTGGHDDSSFFEC